MKENIMVCVVLADKTGISRTVTDKDLLQILTELCDLTGESWELEEHQRQERVGLFSKTVKRYCLYYQAGPEWQIINHVGPTDYSLNHTVKREQVGNFMVGYMAAWHARNRGAR